MTHLVKGRDLSAATRVSTHVRGLSALVAILLVIGCGPKTADTTPKKGSSGTVAYEDDPKKGDLDKVPPVGGGDEPPPPAGDEPPPPAGDEPVAQNDPPKPPPKPPGEDITPEQRKKLVEEHLSVGTKMLDKCGEPGASACATAADTAIQSAQQALALDGSNTDAMILLAHGYYVKGAFEKSEAILVDLFNGFPQTKEKAFVYMLFGLIYERTHREKLALDAYKLAIEKDPKYVAAWSNRGVILLRTRKVAEAADCFKKVISLLEDQGKKKGTQVARAHMHLGSAYRGLSVVDRDQKDEWLKRAKAEFDEALKADQGYAAIYYNYGLLYLDAGTYPGLENLHRLELAVKYLKKYKELTAPPKQHPVHEYLAVAEEEYKNAKAMWDFEQEEKRRAEEEARGGGGQ